ncbi:MAG: hypothetical protein HQL66_10860 [Magnetococcales bacterium]|nr:hypothetical protein [Magnetococcales bacterium]
MPQINLNKMLSLYGSWSVEDGGLVAVFTCGAHEPSHGLSLLNASLDDGTIKCSIEIPEVTQHSGAFVVFRANGQNDYCAAGIGGWEGAYTLLEGRHLNVNRLASAGNIGNIVSGRKYDIKVVVEGQRAKLFVDDVKVIDYDRLPQLSGMQLGLYSFRGSDKVKFGPIEIDDRRPNAFIAMQFSEPYNEVYRDTIGPLVEEIGFEPTRVDEVSQPGIILNDIWLHLTQASVVIAEVSEPNPNVYYEIGVAHAMNKPTILLAQRSTRLPFDLGPHRCVYYDNTIAGRARLLESLRSSLSSILGVSSKK